MSILYTVFIKDSFPNGVTWALMSLEYPLVYIRMIHYFARMNFVNDLCPRNILNLSYNNMFADYANYVLCKL